MAGGAINITIGGNAQQLAQAAAQASASLAGLGNAGNTAAAGLGNVGTAAQAAGRGLNGLAPLTRPSLQGLSLLGNAGNNAGAGLGAIPPAANAAGAALNRARGASGQASTALTDFSRIVQDAPFGIVAIGNNITQLATSFGNLQRTAGGTGAAFRALFSSATGFGGIGLILSAITTAVTFASVGFGAWTRGLTGTKKAADDLAESAKKLVDGIKSVNQVTAEATGGVQGQISQVQSLAAVITDTSKAYSIRKRALEELQQVNKAYFGELKLEDAATGKLTEKVNEYTKALVANAVVKGFTDEISRLSKEIFAQQQIVDAASKKVLEFQSQLANTPRLKANAQGVATQSKEYSNLTDKVASARKEFDTQNDALKKLIVSNYQFQQSLPGAVEASLKFADTTGKTGAGIKKETDYLKQRIAALKELQSLTGLDNAQQLQLASLEIQLANRDSIKAGFTADELQQQIDGIIEKAFPVKTFEFKLDKVAIVPRTIEFSPNLDVGGAVLPDGQIAEGAFDGVVNAIRKSAEKAKTKLNESVTKAFYDGITQSVTEGVFAATDALGAAVGNILSGQGIGNALAAAGESLLSIMGSILQDIGKKIALIGGLAAKLQVAIENIFTNPYAGIAAGLGLIAAGALLKNIKLTRLVVPGFADGVTNFTGGAALVGERGPEIVSLPTGANVNPINPFADGITLVPSIRFSGADFQIMLERVSQRRGQLG